MSKPQRDPNLHKNHRDRLRKTALQTGLDSFEDHVLMELILFSSIPRRDTNETAHRLLDSCGGVSGVLSADKNTITACENVGESTAEFLNVLSSACKKYMLGRNGSQTGFSSVNEARQYLRDSLQKESEPVMAVLTLDSLHRIKTLKIHQKNQNTYTSLLSEAVKDVLSEYSSFAFIAFTHQNGILAPEKDEINLIFSAKEAFFSRGVKLTDALIVTPDDCRFLSESGVFPDNFFEGQSRPKGQPISEPIS